MLAILGFTTIFVLLWAILSKKVAVMTALIAVPVVSSLLAGFGAHTATFMVHGIASVSNVAGMFIFAILYFGIMTDAGMLDPIIDGILRAVGMNPARIVMGTSLLALLVHLDGSGAVTFLITIPVMLPLYQRVGMDRRLLACAASMAAGVNFLPWTGPMIRASASLHIPVMLIFRPLIPAQIAGLVFVFASAWWLGRREDRRLGYPSRHGGEAFRHELDAAQQELRRPNRFWINLALTLMLMTGMIAFRLEPVAVFMFGVVLALWINYPDLAMQRKRVDAHAQAALLMAGILFAAGAFTGIMKESGMLGAMATSVVRLVPARLAPRLPVALGLTAMPMSLLFDPDSFYFGVLPVIADVANKFGVPPLQIAQAALMGLHTTGFPITPLTPATFLVVGLAGIDLRDHQKFSIPLLFAASVVMTAVCVALRLFPI